jgi:hypothetical protein
MIASLDVTFDTSTTEKFSLSVVTCKRTFASFGIFTVAAVAWIGKLGSGCGTENEGLLTEPEDAGEGGTGEYWHSTGGKGRLISGL